MASLRMAIRKLATSAAVNQQQQQLVRPPIQVFGIDGRYATALFSAASKENQLDHVERDINLMGELFQQNARVADALKNPIVSKQDKQGMLQSLAREHNLNPLTLNVFSAMSDNGRLSLLPKFMKTFGNIMSAARGEVLAVVTTAKELDESQRKNLNSALQNFAKKGQKLKVETKVDPNIIGGMVVSVGDRYVDMSTASKIKMYSKIVEETI
ncbi:ATP synthase subunit O, mitochondrial-like [Paramacrobiotus metropolitanus]|uniref:ATP synthase subunit O, mitochondrial-like n=1 Tax=Paramacrobiotus metropolitanus TaxID=2943436 RepID=UPI00244578A0|nr:ATP synthase subunit O, mitochondrial-like [Paramacrobiotus metropolitanus]